jgi:hypothetical protein
MVENRMKKIYFRPSIFLYLSCIFSYTKIGQKNPKMRQETEAVYSGAGQEMGDDASVRIYRILFSCFFNLCGLGPIDEAFNLSAHEPNNNTYKL